jgi:hypothetical protein
LDRKRRRKEKETQLHQQQLQQLQWPVAMHPPSPPQHVFLHLPTPPRTPITKAAHYSPAISGTSSPRRESLHRALSAPTRNLPTTWSSSPAPSPLSALFPAAVPQTGGYQSYLQTTATPPTYTYTLLPQTPSDYQPRWPDTVPHYAAVVVHQQGWSGYQ